MIESGATFAKIASDKKMPESTIRGIFKKRDEIKSQGKDVYSFSKRGHFIAVPSIQF